MMTARLYLAIDFEEQPLEEDDSNMELNPISERS